MNAPLSRFLTRFADDAVSIPVSFQVMMAEPTITLAVGDLQGRIDAARETALREAEAEHAKDVAELRAGHDLAVAAAVAEARALWLADEGAAHADKLASAFAELESSLSTRVAGAVRPLLAAAVVERTCSAVREAISHILTDPEHPTVTVHGPADLIGAIRDTLTTAGGVERVAFVATDAVEIAIHAAGSHIETRLVASLASLNGI